MTKLEVLETLEDIQKFNKRGVKIFGMSKKEFTYISKHKKIICKILGIKDITKVSIKNGCVYVGIIIWQIKGIMII